MVKKICLQTRGKILPQFFHAPCGRVPGESGEEDSADGDGEHTLRELEQPEGLVDVSRRRDADERPHDGVDEGVEVDDAQAEDHRPYEQAHPLDIGVAEAEPPHRDPRALVDVVPRFGHSGRPATVLPPPGPHGGRLQQKFEHRPDEEAPGESLKAVTGREEDHHYDDYQVPNDRRQSGQPEMVVGVEDAHEDPGDAHDHDRGEHDPHEVDREIHDLRVGAEARGDQSDHLAGEDHPQGGDDPQDDGGPYRDRVRDLPRFPPALFLQEPGEYRDEGGRQRGIG